LRREDWVERMTGLGMEKSSVWAGRSVVVRRPVPMFGMGERKMEGWRGISDEARNAWKEE
jgi:hypothetical protein